MVNISLTQIAPFTNEDIITSEYIYDHEFGDGIYSIFIDVCDILENTNKVVFNFKIGEINLNLDVRTDLAVFLEYVKDIFKFLETDDLKDITIDLYEQGVEEEIVISKNDKENLDFLIDEKVFITSGKLFEGNIKKFINDFIDIVEEIYPSLFNNYFFQEWKYDLIK